MMATLKSTPVVATPGNAAWVARSRAAAASDRHTIYWMPLYYLFLSDDEMALLASRTLDIVACA
jgi:hypothetical protein